MMIRPPIITHSPIPMKTTTFFQTLLLVLLMAAGGALFFSCEKLDEPTQEQPQTSSASITTSDVDIQGTWECIYPVPIDTTCYLQITFYEHYYSTTCDGQYYIEQYFLHPQWPSGGYFQGWTKANYLVHSGKFYLWNVEVDQSWAEIPFYSNIPPTFDISLNEDTMSLYCIYTRENCPDLDLPEETHYTFVKLIDKP